MKITNNTKMNHMIMSFSNNYNAISIDRVSSNNNIGRFAVFMYFLFRYVYFLIIYRKVTFSA